jgi:CrcB protein
LWQLAEARNAFTPETRALVFVGILGGFTTFSSFANETFELLRDGQRGLALANVAAQMILGLGAVWLGRALAHKIWG